MISVKNLFLETDRTLQGLIYFAWIIDKLYFLSQSQIHVTIRPNHVNPKLLSVPLVLSFLSQPITQEGNLDFSSTRLIK